MTCLIGFRIGFGLAGAMAVARAVHLAGPVADEIGGFLPAFRVLQVLDELESLIGAGVGIELGFAGVGAMAYRRSRKDQGLALAA